MKLLTVIVNYQTPEMTLTALAATLRALTWVVEEWKITVVDNDSQDGSFDKLCQAVATHQHKNHPGWEHVEVVAAGSNAGYGAGNNVAIRRALHSDDPPEYIYALNSDAFPSGHAITFLIDYLDRHLQVGIVGSYIHGDDGHPHTTAFRFPSIASEFESAIRLGLVSRLLRHHRVPFGVPDCTIPVDWLAGASMMLRRQVIEEAGLFDETFFLYFEETDLCRRALLTGWSTVYVRESTVMHIGSVTTGMKEWKTIPEYWFDSRRHYFVKNHGSLYFWTATSARLLGEGLWQLRRRIQGKKDSGPPGQLWQLVRHSMKQIGKKAHA
jgi:N-acetylglucosaminyl-diphospho-decaprenol L-rhamnosyltransferase